MIDSGAGGFLFPHLVVVLVVLGLTIAGIAYVVVKLVQRRGGA